MEANQGKLERQSGPRDPTWDILSINVKEDEKKREAASFGLRGGDAWKSNFGEWEWKLIKHSEYKVDHFCFVLFCF